MGQAESSETGSGSRWPAADGSGGAGFFPLTGARRLLSAGAPVEDDTQFHSDSEEVGPVILEAVNWPATRRSWGAAGNGSGEARVADRQSGAEVRGSVPVHRSSGEAGGRSELDGGSGHTVAVSADTAAAGTWSRQEDGGETSARSAGELTEGQRYLGSAPTAVWYARLDREQEEEEGRLSQTPPDGAVSQWLRQLASWVHLTPGISSGKSQSMETASSGSPSRQQRQLSAPAPAPGLAQRSLDSVWPPAISRGASMASQPEKVDKPPKLVKYTVQERDTLTSIAARLDCLPTELMKANRLGARLVFPGQVLLVPSRETPEPPPPPEAADRAADAPGGGGRAAVEQPPGGGGARTQPRAGADQELDRDCLMKYVKIKTRHITDGQGVVTGTLLVTPNCLMFDPNVSDPLVLEHGADQYGVMVPMDYIVSAALYTDIAHMKVKDRGNIPLPDLPAPEVYHAPPRGTASPSSAPTPAPAPAGGPAVSGAPEERPEPEQERREQGAEQEEPSQDRKPSQERESSQERQSSRERELEPERPAPREQQSVEEPEPEPLSKELTFPELSLRSGGSQEGEGEEGEPAEPRDTAAFPKAFERQLVTPEMARGDGDGPAEGALPPAEPAGGAPAAQCAEGAPLPAELTGPPSERTEPPSERTEPPSERTEPPSERTEPPSERTEPPSERTEAAERRSVQFTQRAETHPDEFDETKKQKRLSHPLTWMESLSGGGPGEREPTPASAPPHIENSPKSMLSNVVSSVSSVSSALVSSPRYIVDLGSGLLSSLTPAEMEQAAGAPTPAAPAPAPAPETAAAEEEGRREGNSTFYADRCSAERRPRAQTSFGGYKNLVSMEEMPSLFTSFDELIPKPSRAADDPPLYLCLIMGKRRGRKIRKTVRILSYGEEKLRSEFWFSVPRDKSDQLYHFIQYWAPEIYGDLVTTQPEQRGFELVDSDTDIWEACDEDEATPGSGASAGDSGLIDLPKQLPKQSWEVGGMSDELRRALCSNSMTSMDMEFVPELIGKSELLTDEIRKALCKKIPPRVEGHPWSLIFSSSEHGFSLKSLYRKTSAHECPMLLFVQDTDDQIFGALCSTTIHMSEHYYGTGETFLFTFHEQFRTFNWSGENLYFARGSPDGLEFGSGDGHYGLYLDGDLYRGRTQRCLTFNNEPLTGKTDFIVRAVELWALT